jgi:ribosomal protein L12E/L44/L45/RPP1/RPP2
MDDIQAGRQLSWTTIITAVITLIGTICGYAAGALPQYLSHEDKIESNRNDQAQFFSEALKSDTTGLASAHGSTEILAYLGSLCAIASSAEDASLREDQKRTVISLVAMQPDPVRISMLIVYKDDPDAQEALNDLPAAKSALLTAEADQQRSSAKAPGTVDVQAQTSLAPNVSIRPASSSGWIYLGKGLYDKNHAVHELFDAYVFPTALPHPGAALTLTGNMNLRIQAPAGKTLGAVEGVLLKGSRVKIEGQPLVTAYTSEAAAIWAPVSLL